MREDEQDYCGYQQVDLLHKQLQRCDISRNKYRVISFRINHLIMKNTYWFSRAFSQPKTQIHKPNSSRPQENTSKHIQTQLSASKNQCLHSAQAIYKLVQSFEELNSLNQMHHSELVQKGAIKQLKCLKHNSAIIVYCLSDNELLCSVCAFGGVQHVKHKLSEAKGNLHNLEINVMKAQKLLKLKCQQIAEEKRKWQIQLGCLEKIKKQTLDELQRQYEDALAALSLTFARSKTKINELFVQSQENFNFIVSSLERLMASLKCAHSLTVVKQLYYQEITTKINGLNRMMPNTKVGEVMASSIKEIAKSIIKIFKNMSSPIKK